MQRRTPDEILRLLRQVRTHRAEGRKLGEIVRGMNISLNTYYNWVDKFKGQLEGEQPPSPLHAEEQQSLSQPSPPTPLSNGQAAARIKQLEDENALLKGRVAWLQKLLAESMELWG